MAVKYECLLEFVKNGVEFIDFLDEELAMGPAYITHPMYPDSEIRIKKVYDAMTW
jgi:hypothetical protein